MFEKYDKKSTYLFYLLILFEIIIVTLLGFRTHENISFRSEPYNKLNDSWTYIDKSGYAHLIDLPSELKTGLKNGVIISKKLPDTIHHLTTLCMLSTNQNIYAYLDNELIYKREDNSYHKYLNIPTGTIWTFIPLPDDSNNKTITLRITSEDNNHTVTINEIYAGTKSALLLQIINSSSINLVIAIIILINGIMLTMIYLFLKRLLTINRSILFLGWFSILSSVWMIIRSNLTQIFMDNEYVISSLSYLSMLALPIPIILYIALLDHLHYRKCLYFIAYNMSGSAFIFILLQFFNILNFHDTEIIVMFENFIFCSLILIILILNYFLYKNKEIKVILVSGSILILSGALEILSEFTLINIPEGVIFQFAFLIFIIILAWDKLNKAAEIIKLSESAKHYKFLATRDLLTNCRNRISYAKDMDKVSLDRNIIIFVSDMDNMKHINDTYGHHAGDEVIILCSQCLLKVFGRRVYRIGGDEFVCIQYDLTNENIEALLTDFLKECDMTNEDSPYAFHMSIGYAVFDKTIDKTIYDTVKRADKDMYARKNKLKNAEKS